RVAAGGAHRRVLADGSEGAVLGRAAPAVLRGRGLSGHPAAALSAGARHGGARAGRSSAVAAAAGVLPALAGRGAALLGQAEEPRAAAARKAGRRRALLRADGGSAGPVRSRQLPR